MSGPVDKIHALNERLIEQLKESNQALNVLRAELKAAQEERDEAQRCCRELQEDVKTLSDKFWQNEQISQLTRERDSEKSIREAIGRDITDAKLALSAAGITGSPSIVSFARAAVAEIARLRQERVSAANEMLDRVLGSLREYPHGGGDIEVMREVERIISEATDRMRKALEDADHAVNCSSRQEVHRTGFIHYETDSGEPCPIYHYERGECDCFKQALNPQPAQPNKNASKKFQEGYPVYTCRNCNLNYEEHGEDGVCPASTTTC